jgi:hypothetical protein
MVDRDRRKFLKSAGGVALGLMATGGLSGYALACSETDWAAVPWPYVKLDKAQVANKAYSNYGKGG